MLHGDNELIARLIQIAHLRSIYEAKSIVAEIGVVVDRIVPHAPVVTPHDDPIAGHGNELLRCGNRN